LTKTVVIHYFGNSTTAFDWKCAKTFYSALLLFDEVIHCYIELCCFSLSAFCLVLFKHFQILVLNIFWIQWESRRC